MNEPLASGVSMFEGEAVVFTGPSLHPDEARQMVKATVLPPVRRGDLEHAASMRPRMVGIIDGEFYQSLAVSPKEILPLLDSGVRVYGGASMGALRAVELRRDGMIGVGSVFRLFRSGVLDGDDEVALTYSPASYQAISEALVNTRYSLRAAVKRGILRRSAAVDVIERLKQIYFPERTTKLLLSMIRESCGAETASQLRDFFAAEAPNVKRQDARLLLARMRAEVCSLA